MIFFIDIIFQMQEGVPFPPTQVMVSTSKAWDVGGLAPIQQGLWYWSALRLLWSDQPPLIPSAGTEAMKGSCRGPATTREAGLSLDHGKFHTAQPCCSGGRGHLQSIPTSLEQWSPTVETAHS